VSDGPMQTCTRRRAGAGGVGDMEETFCPMEDAADESEAEATSSEEERMEQLVLEAKVRLKSDGENADSFKERVASILDEKLTKLVRQNVKHVACLAVMC